MKEGNVDLKFQQQRCTNSKSSDKKLGNYLIVASPNGGKTRLTELFIEEILAQSES